MWGVVESFDNEEIHIVPVDSGGAVLNGHTCDVDCWCSPIVDKTEPRMLVHFDAPRSLH